MKRTLTAFIALVLGLSAAIASGAQAANATPAPADQLRPLGVRILAGSRINLVSHESKLPIAITNDFDTEVRVFVHVRPQTLQVVLPEVTEIKIPAQTTVTAKIPISATADGDVFINAWLTSFSGQRFGKAVELQVTVNEDVELFLVLGFAGVVGALIFVGVVRTLRRRARTAEVAS